ncbi:AMP-binding protein [Streptomyces canus]|uniref:AMP-binding protein n=1 Tax=Streptomyces canus TaxID=58343 RepID=UPI002E2B2D05|nr:AMP-binding protein [Streptomyces canus]
MHPDSDWIAGSPCTAPDEGLHETVARRARERPGAVALVAADRRMTYGELDRTADAWAAGLASAGAEPGDVVPILLPRGLDLVTALLAVLKTGAAYALLDPAWPEGRLAEVFGTLRAPLVIARGEVGADQAPPVWGPPPPGAEAPDGYRPVPVGGSDAACVFFTSGTTGRPKGVLTPHRATARLFQPGGFARFGPDTVMPLAAPVPWDAFSLELWSVLLNGGTSLLPEEPYLSAQALRGAVSAHGADTVWLTSSLFNMVVDEDPDAFTGLRQVMTGGERLSPVHVGRFLARHPGIVLLNGYGPVEGTVFATTHRVTPADCLRTDGVPLGRPVPGTRIHVLDGARSCAVGETGEICIAGEGLALRYLADDALTKAKFTRAVIDRVSVLLYRTGDLGVWDTDGLLHYRGRADRQVKIRGHRVEPAEVERQVERLLPGVRHCRVLARRDEAGTVQELLAFCVPVDPGDGLENALPVLRSGLVSYQRPAAVVSIGSFPVTPQGKLDERALLTMASGPEADRPAPAPPRVGSAAAPERDWAVSAVSEAFGAVLGESDPPHDVPFLELGGSSLGAGRVCARLGVRLARPVPVSRLYEHPTVEALAHWLRTGANAAPSADAPSASASSDGTPLTPMQIMYMTRELLDPADRTAYCLLTWVIEGDLDPAALTSAVTAVHRRHEALRAAYVLDPHPAAVLSPVPAPVPLELPGESSVDEAIRALRYELSDELDLAGGEVWRTALVPVRSGRFRVFGCVVHHVAFDGWSESVLAHDLAAAYTAATGAAKAAPPLPPSLATAHVRRAERLAQLDLDDHRDRLLEELADVPALRWPQGLVADTAGAPGRTAISLSPAVVAAIDAQAARLGVSRFVVLLHHWARALAELTGQYDFTVGVPVAQRSDAGLEQAIGSHINMVCLRLRGVVLDEGAVAVEETGRVVRRALVAQDVPVPDIAARVRGRRPGATPLYQTLFALQDNALPRLDLAGLRTEFVRQPYLDLPLDLHTELWPAEGGGLHVEVSHRRESVAHTTAEELAKRFTHRLHALTPEDVS